MSNNTYEIPNALSKQFITYDVRKSYLVDKILHDAIHRVIPPTLDIGLQRLLQIES